MARDLHSGVSAVIEDSHLTEALLIRLDIETDPVYVWTGVGNKTFVGTNDAALVLPGGAAFESNRGVGELGPVTDAQEGSEAVKLVLPGVSLTDDYLNEIINQGYKWQFRKAYIWLAHLDADGDIIGEPTRIKTGRIDTMEVKQEEGEGTNGRLEVTIESYQAYSQEALMTRYAEQKDIDSTDTSQDYVHALANKQAEIGQQGSRPGGGGSNMRNDGVGIDRQLL